ncbi:MAG TPA: molybdenum cofactor guanylyltransferase MobA [Burkholderiales bacterium]|nr:molybdenum cofactor guanylyltransferase MobA [Burkholderiales bacterium]
MAFLNSSSGRDSRVTGVVLAGGQGRRMGTVDKGLQTLQGKPLVQWVIERFGPQVDELLINANQTLDRYRAFGYRVIPDEIGGFAGPLAGLQRALSEARHDWVATVPCDSPFLPQDLVSRLAAALVERKAHLAVAKTGDQPHPVFCLCRKSVLPGLTAFLMQGGRKIDAWYADLATVEVPFDDVPAAFSNINTRDELQNFERGDTSG